jgi:hypothetical protein
MQWQMGADTKVAWFSYVAKKAVQVYMAKLLLRRARATAAFHRTSNIRRVSQAFSEFALPGPRAEGNN